MTSSSTCKYVSKLKGVRALVIGGTSGIGFGIAEALIEHGAHVFVSSSQEWRVARAVRTLKERRPSSEQHVEGIVCDLSHKEHAASNVQHLFAEVRKTGLLDHTVFTAGDAFTLGSVADFDLSDMQNAGMVRFFGPLLVAQQLSQATNMSTASSFTLTTGGLHRRPRKGWAIMMSYLAGLEGMTRALARDLAPVRVNLVGPGPTDTEIWDSHQETVHVDQLKRNLANNTVTKQIGRVEDVVESYIYLMKDRNMTGGTVYTNGGALLV